MLTLHLIDVGDVIVAVGDIRMAFAQDGPADLQHLEIHLKGLGGLTLLLIDVGDVIVAAYGVGVPLAQCSTVDLQRLKWVNVPGLNNDQAGPNSIQLPGVAADVLARR